MKLKPYPEYKDSGAEWLGAVPKHWSCLPNRAIFREIKDQGYIDEPLLSVTIKRGVIRQTDLLADSSKKDSSNLDKSKYKLVIPGDIAYNKMRAWQGAVGVSRYRGIVSPAYIVVRPYSSNNPDFFHFLLRTPGFATEAERWSYGITSDQWSLRPEHFKMIYCCIPSHEERDSIVTFLRQLDRHISRFIRNKQRLIKLLQEQKQAFIDRAVTRGFNPNVRLKPSGIDWMGDVPKHWEVFPAKFVSKVFIPQRDKPELNEHRGIPWITPENIGDTFVKLSGLYVTREAAISTGSRAVQAGSVIANCVGRFGIASISEVPVIINQQLQAFVPTSAISPKFMRYCVQTAKPYFEMKGNSTTLAYVNRQGFENMPMPCPSKSEQSEIVSFIESESARTDKAITYAHSQIDFIREYRTSLIADVVTGKVDVRDLLVVPFEESEILEEMDELAEANEQEILQPRAS